MPCRGRRVKSLIWTRPPDQVILQALQRCPVAQGRQATHELGAKLQDRGRLASPRSVTVDPLLVVATLQLSLERLKDLVVLVSQRHADEDAHDRLAACGLGVDRVREGRPTAQVEVADGCVEAVRRRRRS